MASNKLPVGSFVWIHRNDLQPILDRLEALGYRIIGPQIRDRAVILDELDSADRLPRGVRRSASPIRLAERAGLVRMPMGLWTAGYGVTVRISRR